MYIYIYRFPTTHPFLPGFSAASVFLFKIGRGLLPNDTFVSQYTVYAKSN